MAEAAIAAPLIAGAGGTAGIASGASIASLGLGAFSAITEGYGKQAANEAQAARAERAAQFGRLQANLTDTTMRDELNTTLGNIDVIRAAARIDPSSPTTAAIEDRQRLVSDRQRTAAVLSIRSQVAEDEASARFLRESGDFAVTQGYLKAATGVAGGVARGFSGGAPSTAVSRS